MSNSKNNLRNNNIDALKGLMITLVVFGHITYIGELKNYFEILRSYIYVFHMPIFLMVTGYFITIPISIKKLTNSLLIPYILFFSIYLVILLITTKLDLLEKSNSIESFSSIFHAIIFQPLASYWYLHSLILFSFILIIVNKIEKVILNKERLLFTITVFYLIQTIFILFNFKLFYWVTSYIWIGIIFKEIVKNGVTKGSITPMLLLFFASFFIKDFDLMRTSISISVICAILYLLRKIRSSTLTLIGRNSLLIFLFHVYFLNIIKVFSYPILGIDSYGILFVVLSLVLSVCGSLLIGHFIDKLNLSNFIFGTKEIIK